MGSPKGELGHRRNETLHEVTVSTPFYIGVFPVAQQQWANVMGTTPSHFRGDHRPVEGVTYPMIRGEEDGTGWPAHDRVDASSFMGVLRDRTGGLWDLPTDAQWEYACRAGTTTALNSGEDLEDPSVSDRLDKIGRYKHNQRDDAGGYRQHTTVGFYHPNAWGIYDMHGNVWEWVLDWTSPDLRTAPVIDPRGALEGTRRMVRGGCWSYGANGCRSAFRSDSRVDGVHRTLGLRVALPGV